MYMILCHGKIKKKFIIQNLNDLDIDELIDNIGIERIISYLRREGYSIKME